MTEDRLAEALADSYLLEEELGRGASATVYLAQDRLGADLHAGRATGPGGRDAPAGADLSDLHHAGRAHQRSAVDTTPDAPGLRIIARGALTVRPGHVH